MFKNASMVSVSPCSGSAALNASNVELVTTLLVRAFQATIVWGEEGTFKIVSPALVCCEGVHICLT